MSQKIHDMITERICDILERGEIPWRKPWRRIGAPKNLISKKPYRGVNVLTLCALGYDSPWFLTFKQAKELGGAVRKGEKGLSSRQRTFCWRVISRPEKA